MITRQDLTYGQQASQLCHALRQFCHDHPDIDKQWFEISNYICLLSVESEKELYNICSKADNNNLKYSKFLEPDLNNSLTAICLEPSKLTKKLVNNIKLAF